MSDTRGHGVSLFGDSIRSALLRVLPVVRADSAALHAVGTDLAPLADGVPDIRMAAERVEISLFPTMAVVEAVFDLVNEGPETTIPVGFPAYGRPGDFKSTEAGMMDFQASVAGVPLRHVERQIDNVAFPAWFAWQQTFPERATSRLAVRYWTPLVGYAGASRLPFTYVLRTGRFWKDGRIGAVDVIVRAAGIPMRSIREAAPAGYELDARAKELRWSLRDHVPEDDIGLLISPLEQLASELGQRVLDPLDVHEASPPEGTRLMVVGTPTFNPFPPDPVRLGLIARIFGSKQQERPRPPFTGLLMGERRQDRNIVVPDGIRAFHGDDASTSLRLVVSRVTTESRRVVSSHDRGWWKALVTGRIRRDNEGLYMQVDEWAFLDVDDPPEGGHPQARRSFPWVTGEPVIASDWTSLDRPPGGWRIGDKPGSRQVEQDAQHGARARVPHDA